MFVVQRGVAAVQLYTGDGDIRLPGAVETGPLRFCDGLLPGYGGQISRNVNQTEGEASSSQWPFDARFDYTYDGVMRSYEDSLCRLALNRVEILY